MSQQQYTTSVNAPTPPDAGEIRRRKLEQNIADLFGPETPMTANYHAPLRPVTPLVTTGNPAAWRGTVSEFFDDAVHRADAGKTPQSGVKEATT